MPMEIVEHRPGDDLVDIRRFRYDVYLGELGWDSPEADHDRRELGDHLDEFAIIHSIVDEGRIMGTLRTVCAADLPDLAAIATKQVAAGVERFGAGAVVTTSRFMLSADLRGGTSILRLIRACQSHAMERGVRLNYGDCSPHLLPFYEHMGYRRFAPAFNDANYGWKFPILMVVNDRDRFQEVRSPLRSLMGDDDDDVEAREWFARTYPDALDEHSARHLGMDEFVEVISEATDRLTNANMLGRLDAAELRAVLASGTIVEARTGDRIIREGERGSSLFVILEGALDVLGDEGSGGVIATLGAGDIVGEQAFLADGIRSASVDAVGPSTILVLDGAAVGKALAKNASLATSLGDALAEVVSARSTPPRGRDRTGSDGLRT